MATTKIWRIKRQLGYVLRYAANEEKTEVGGQYDPLNSALGYVTQEGKTVVGPSLSANPALVYLVPLSMII